jgi:hypothetical protein
MYTQTYNHGHIYTCIHTYVRTYIHTYIHTYIRVYNVSCNSRELNSRSALLEFQPGRSVSCPVFCEILQAAPPHPAPRTKMSEMHFKSAHEPFRPHPFHSTVRHHHII